jgi:hypothetical protein
MLLVGSASVYGLDALLNRFGLADVLVGEPTVTPGFVVDPHSGAQALKVKSALLITLALAGARHTSYRLSSTNHC